jgi:hypothetical protein
MAIEVQLVVSGGAPQNGGITVTAADTVQAQLNANLLNGVQSVLWEIYEYPPTAACPAGWTADATAMVFYYQATSATAFMPPAIVMAGRPWGKWFLRATANNGVMGGAIDYAATRDESAAWSVASTGGVVDAGALEEDQFSPLGPMAAVKTFLRSTSVGMVADGLEIYPVTAYGAVGDGITNDRAAIQACINACSAAGGGVVYFPPGTYGIGTSAVYLADGVSLMGCGHGASILRILASNTTTNMIVYAAPPGPYNNVLISDLGFEGNWLAQPTRLSSGGLVALRYCVGLKISRCRFSYSRYFSIDVLLSSDVEVSNCVIEWSCRDSIAVWLSPTVNIHDNIVRHGADDAISCHVSLSFPVEPVRDGIVIANNQIEDCASIKVLSAKRVTIVDNQLRRMRNAGITVGTAAPDAQGDEVSFCVRIEGNTITDVIDERWFLGLPAVETNGLYIGVGTTQLNDGGDLPAYPGDVDTATGIGYPVWGGTNVSYLYEEDVDEVGKHSPGNWWLTVRNNICVRTLGAVANYSDWGYGVAMNHQGAGTRDDAVDDADLYRDGIRILTPLRHALIEGNIIQTGRSGIRMGRQLNNVGVGQPLEDLLAKRVVIRGNDVFDARLAGICWDVPNTGVAEVAPSVQDIDIIDNFFDLDPWNLHANRNGAADGTWLIEGDGPFGIDLTNISGTLVRGNQFRNACVPYIGGEAVCDRNLIRSTPASVGFSVSNVGVGTCPAPGDGWWYLIEDGDLTSATFGQLLPSQPLRESATMPGTGTYVAGMFVRCNSATNGVHGWRRLTTGSAHVAGTDWEQVGGAPQYVAYTTPGATAVTIPTTAKILRATVIGGGGGGGSGRVGATTTNRYGGAGGNAGGKTEYTLNAADLRAVAATISVAVGTGGTGGAATTTDDTDGSAGSAGGESSVTVGANKLVRAGGGGGGGGGTNAAGAVSAAIGAAELRGAQGGAGATGAGAVGGNGSGGLCGGGGGGGGGLAATNTPAAGGNGGVGFAISNTYPTGGVAPGGAGSSGGSALLTGQGPGKGGGGGASATATNSGAGGAGQAPGGGGGGSGAAQNGNDSAVGGAGGNGAVYLTWVY